MGAPSVTPSEDRIRLRYRMRVRHLFRQMMARRGVDLNGAWWHGLEGMLARAMERCADCPAASICQDWLDHASASDPSPAFCPNARTIEACQIMQSSSNDGDAAPETVAELLSDPMVQQAMAADRVNSEVLRLALTQSRCFLAALAAPNSPKRV